jgi:hypothetical protein
MCGRLLDRPGLQFAAGVQISIRKIDPFFPLSPHPPLLACLSRAPGNRPAGRFFYEYW